MSSYGHAVKSPLMQKLVRESGMRGLEARRRLGVVGGALMQVQAGGTLAAVAPFDYRSMADRSFAWLALEHELGEGQHDAEVAVHEETERDE